MKYGVQLFSLRKYLKDEKGYDEVFSRVKKAGAEVVQLSGGKPMPAAYIAELSRKHSLPVVVTHDSFSRLQNDLDALVEEHRIYSCNALGIGMMPKEFRTGEAKDLSRFVSVLNSLSEKLAEAGMTIAYHNHWFEFDVVGGKRIFDALIEDTDPRVRFIPDTYWIRFAGEDVCKFLEKLSGRAETIHLKDYKHKIFRAVGRGELDFASVLSVAERCGVKYAVAELDISPRPFASMEYSMNTIRELKDAKGER